jgi:hypothetical protein
MTRLIKKPKIQLINGKKYSVFTSANKVEGPYKVKFTINKQHKKPIQHEDIMCQAFIRHLDNIPKLRKYRPYILHIANERKCSWAQGKKLKAMGVMAGAADYLIMKPLGMKTERRFIQNLYLEFKYGKNRQSPAQKTFEKIVTSCGHLYKVVYTIDEAIAEIKKFWGNHE